MIPPELVGVWRRISIRLGDAPPGEPCDVLWIQARSGFADLRVPRGADGEPAAFAGFTSWEEPALTWHHLLDLAPSPPDVGRVEWRGADLVERGTALVDGDETLDEVPYEVPYEEVWRRVDRPGDLPILVLARGDEPRGCDAMVVRVGSHSLSMGATRLGFAARAARRVDGTWHTIGELGTAETLPGAPDPDPGWWVGQRIELPGAGPWTVRESECA